MCPAWPVCTTSTTSLIPKRFQVWWCTATNAPLCFANADNFRHRALAAVDASPQPVTWFLLNAEANVEVDITAVDAITDLRTELNRRGITFAMARVKQDLRNDLEAAGLIERIGPDLIFPTLPTAVAAYRQVSGVDEPHQP